MSTPRRKRNPLPAIAQAGPVSLWMILFVTLPMLFIIYISFMTRGTFGGVEYTPTLEAYKTMTLTRTVYEHLVVFFFLFNLFLPKKERNAMGAAIGTTAGNAAITPQAVAAVDPAYATSVELSTSMIVSAGMVTFLCCPIVTAICDRYMRKYKKGIYSPEGRVGKEENK